MQGGAFNQGFRYGTAVSGAQQQYWTWQAVGRGAKTVLYWSWRDEVWGVESGGYGIDGQDGLAGDRKKGIRATRKLLDAHSDALGKYVPDVANIGVVFDSDSAMIALATREHNTYAVTHSLNGCLSALERQRLPFDLLDGRRLSIPEDIKLILLPAALCLKEDAVEAILAFMKRGGWVFSEAGTGLFLENGFMVDRPERRALLGQLGIGQTRRRGAHIDASCEVPAGTWPGSPAISLGGSGLWSIGIAAPENARVIAKDAEGDAMLVELKAGKGRFVMSGSFPANSYNAKAYPGFEQLLWTLAENAGALPDWKVESGTSLDGLAVRTGLSGKKRLFFVFNAGSAKKLTIRPADAGTGEVKEWTSGKTIKRQEDGSFEISVSDPAYRIFEWTAEPKNK